MIIYVVLEILLGAGLYVFERIVGMIVHKNGRMAGYLWKDRKRRKARTRFGSSPARA